MIHELPEAPSVTASDMFVLDDGSYTRKVSWGLMQSYQADSLAWLIDTSEQQRIDIDENRSRISTNTSNISANTFNISTNQSNISTNTSNIMINALDIEALMTGTVHINSIGTTVVQAGTKFINADAGDGGPGDIEIDLSNLEYASDGWIVYVSYRYDGASGAVIVEGSSGGPVYVHSYAGSTFTGWCVLLWDSLRNIWNLIADSQ